MTDEQWGEILHAYAQWVSDKKNPPVQYHSTGLNAGWVDWEDTDTIHRRYPLSGKWRVKPQPSRSRMFYSLDDPFKHNSVGIRVWYSANEEPKVPCNCEWLGDWIDIPETDR
jgi:hypothetical protein